jgi:hypothetical protein
MKFEKIDQQFSLGFKPSKKDYLRVAKKEHEKMMV